MLTFIFPYEPISIGNHTWKKTNNENATHTPNAYRWLPSLRSANETRPNHRNRRCSALHLCAARGILVQRSNDRLERGFRCAAKKCLRMEKLLLCPQILQASWRSEVRRLRRDESLPTESNGGTTQFDWEELMAGLNQQQRELLWLRFGEKLPIESIARIQQCPPGTIKSRMNKVMGLLKARWNHKAQ